MMSPARKRGYSGEARFREARVADGGYYDGPGYGAPRGEWKRRHPAGFAAHPHRSA